MNILEKIIANKHKEVAQAKKIIGIHELTSGSLFFRESASLKRALSAKEEPGIIAEFKRKSPSKGSINDRVSPEDVTRGYVEAGASCLSVLTDTEFFGGGFEDFRRARAANPTIPMLRKDFIIDEYQLYEAKALGADVILLIAACLSPKEIQTLGSKAQALGMEVLLEVHNASELEQSLCDVVDMVGVNNRNLKTFTTSIETSLTLSELIPSRFVKISESGLKDAQTIKSLYSAGYEGFLIGETFMVAEDPAAAMQQLSNEIHSLFHHPINTLK